MMGKENREIDVIRKKPLEGKRKTYKTLVQDIKVHAR